MIWYLLNAGEQSKIRYDHRSFYDLSCPRIQLLYCTLLHTIHRFLLHIQYCNIGIEAEEDIL